MSRRSSRRRSRSATSPTPHDDQQWGDFYWNVVFTDDGNQVKVLDKDEVIKARMLEMDFFMKMGVKKKVDRDEVKKNKGKIVSTKWVDTDKGHGGYRSRLVGREIKRDKRQDLFSPTPPLEVLKLLIAYCANNQRTDKPKRIGVIDVSRAYFYATCKRALKISSAESELHAMSKCAQHALHLDFGIVVNPLIRHVQVQYLWIQQEVANEHVKIQKVQGTDNPDDALTKFLAEAELERHMAQMNYV